MKRPKNLSPDSILGIIELYYQDRYKVVNRLETKLVLRSRYKYKSNGWEVIQKRLNFNDIICFKVLEDTVRFEVIIWKQIMVFSAFLILGFILSWVIWELPIGVSLLIPLIPFIVTCSLYYYKILEFANRVKSVISERINS